jgi:hypothetical protein
MTPSTRATQADAPAGEWSIAVGGDRIQRLLIEILEQHWRDVTIGPLIEGAAWEIRFAQPPKLSMLDGYLTVDTGPWHFHLCVNDHAGAPTPERAARRRVARAAFYREHGDSCLPMSWGLRLWNGWDEQMVTVLFPNPYFDPDDGMHPEPRWERLAVWEDLRRRYADDPR